MAVCKHCVKVYKPGNWKWSAWFCHLCVAAQIPQSLYGHGK